MIQSHEQRTCKECGFVGPLERFATYTGRDGSLSYRHVCLRCRAAHNAAWHKKRMADWEARGVAAVDEGSEKRCPRCSETKPITDFIHMEKGKRRHPNCSSCRSEHNKKWRHENVTRMKEYRAARRAEDPDYYRKQNLRHFFKLSVEEFDAMLAAQGGVCAACGTDDPGQRNWAVDHNHSCCPGRKSCGNCLRGILCAKCNLTLGQVNDDPAVLQSMIDYLTADRRPALRAI